MSVRSPITERSDWLRSLRAAHGALQRVFQGATPHRHGFGAWERSRVLSRAEHRFVMVRRCACGAIERLPSR